MICCENVVDTTFFNENVDILLLLQYFQNYLVVNSLQVKSKYNKIINVL